MSALRALKSVSLGTHPAHAWGHPGPPAPPLWDSPRDTGWLAEPGQGLCRDPGVSRTGWHPHTWARAAQPSAGLTSSEPLPAWFPEGTRQGTLPHSRTQPFSHPEPPAASQAGRQRLQMSGCLQTLSSDSAWPRVRLVAPTPPARSDWNPVLGHLCKSCRARTLTAA